MSRRPLRIPSLDGMRAVAFGIVFADHAGVGHVSGGLGVTIFFFLSGYLITTLMRVEAGRSGGVSLRAFYRRRALRILPPLYLTLLVAAALTASGATPGTVTIAGLASQGLHLTNYFIIVHGRRGLASGTNALWSLAVEEHFYLLFPLLYLGLRRWLPSAHRQGLVLLGVCGAFLAWKILLVVAMHPGIDRMYLATDTRADSILSGCVLALWGNPVLDADAGSAGLLRVSDELIRWRLLPAALLLLGAATYFPSRAFSEALAPTLQGLALFPIFVAAIRFPDWGPFRILNTRVLAYLGVLSYGMYLVHEIVLRYLGRGGLFRGAAALVLTIAAAAIMHQFVERPLARFRQRRTSWPAHSDRADAGVSGQ